ncbi:MAG: hypothetical protein C0505_04480 [Leptothrix sp. (in: Bacteria)]|nr:hypothetical protein [Leptothrix sp. (in: b-proteobacteria)]
MCHQRHLACAAGPSVNGSLLDDFELPLTAALRDGLRLTSIAAPVLALDAVHRLWQSRAVVLWHPPAGLRAVGAGVAATVRVDGAARFARARGLSRRAWPSDTSGHEAHAPPPRLWGGFAFAPGAAALAPWTAFGDGSFVLPRLTYWLDGPRAWLQAVGPAADDTLARELAAALAQLVQLAATAADAEDAADEPYRAPPGTQAPLDAAAWHRQVEDILRAIGDARVRKVVAASCAELSFGQALSVAGVLDNLHSETGPVWRFAMSRQGSTFLGASPEMLVRRRGDVVQSEALAGTLAKALGSGTDLLASAKDLREHAFVRDGIVQALAPLCGALDAPRAPMLRELSRLYHLATPIEGRLARPLHVLELCELLHPTPATCGTPRADALRMIVGAEARPRGWYAGPVGWFDAAGDGEFIVALRCGLLAGRHAYVHAGAGIVEGSQADKELAETQLKQGVLLRALGLVHG